MKEHFISGWDLSFNRSQQSINYLVTQAVDEEVAMNLDSYIHLIYDDNDLLSEATIYTEGEIDDDEHLIENLMANEAIGNLKYLNLPIHKIFNFEFNDDGIHQLGGEPPTDFQFPTLRTKVPFQYLGFIDNQDQIFHWLPFKMHLICPIYLNFDKLFIDYSNPNTPTILNEEEIKNADTNYDDILEDSEIIYNKYNFNTVLIDYLPFDIGHTGVPKWIQNAEIPNCPKSNKTMKFLCQLHGNEVKTKKINFTPKNESFNQDYEKMSFWGDGELYVFFEPTSKIACYFIQNS